MVSVVTVLVTMALVTMRLAVNRLLTIVVLTPLTVPAFRTNLDANHCRTSRFVSQ